MRDHLAIQVEGLGKEYLIRHQQKGYLSVREEISRSARRLGRRLMGRTTPAEDDEGVENFWALKDISVDVAAGDVLGVIGKNGAGKSTLLKLLSRITEPTEGSIKARGRIASLLEVGTGFHPELTGRENIYLNGAILGMSRSEITRKFDAIVDFAEIERFLDTPVKRYSSGMYVRLAFAVAAQLDSDILVIDEVLAVGDAEFQKKCLGSMGDVARRGRTVIFVSHSMAAVRALCNRAILLDRGRLVAMGAVDDLIGRYMQSSSTGNSVVVPRTVSSSTPHIRQIKTSTPSVSYGGHLNIEVAIYSPVDAQIGLEMEVRDERGVSIAYLSTSPMLDAPITVQSGSTTTAHLTVGPLCLATGQYRVHFWLLQPWVENYHIVDEPLSFEVVHSDPGSTGFEFRQSYGRGAFTIPMEFRFESDKNLAP